MAENKKQHLGVFSSSKPEAFASTPMTLGQLEFLQAAIALSRPKLAEFYCPDCINQMVLLIAAGQESIHMLKGIRDQSIMEDDRIDVNDPAVKAVEEELDRILRKED